MKNIKFALGVYRDGCKVNVETRGHLNNENEIISLKIQHDLESLVSLAKSSFPNVELLIEDDDGYCYRLKDYIIDNPSMLSSIIVSLVSRHAYMSATKIVLDNTLDDEVFNSKGSLVIDIINYTSTKYTFSLLNKLSLLVNDIGKERVTTRLFNNKGLIGHIENRTFSTYNMERMMDTIYLYFKDYYSDIIIPEVSEIGDVLNIDNGFDFNYVMCVRKKIGVYNNALEEKIISVACDKLQDTDLFAICDDLPIEIAVKLTYRMASYTSNSYNILNWLFTDTDSKKINILYEAGNKYGILKLRLKEFMARTAYNPEHKHIYEDIFDMDITLMDSTSDIMRLLYYTSYTRPSEINELILIYSTTLSLISDDTFRQNKKIIQDSINNILTNVNNLQVFNNFIYGTIKNILDVNKDRAKVILEILFNDILDGANKRRLASIYNRTESLIKKISGLEVKNEKLKKIMLEQKLKK